ncbi:hypothetical protein DTL42_16050 [Bremerella cremea]|uniref:Uncharacterized protein n=1 Tax=Bremerella cremea TaxID=1031537 RepID=A0A368KS66_9BACT|nr:hypothetical protein DTL42_16050 [Bremerella cremea]
MKTHATRGLAGTVRQNVLPGLKENVEAYAFSSEGKGIFRNPFWRIESKLVGDYLGTTDQIFGGTASRLFISL